MAGKKIIVFISSTRDGRFGERVAQAVRPILEKAGLSIQIFGTLFYFIKLTVPPVDNF